jgi:multiple sugar transport system permease protein
MTVLLALPALLLMAIVFGWPMLRYAWLSFHADSVLTGLVPIPNGGANWLRLLTDSRFWLDAGQTSRFAMVSVGLELILALAIALLASTSAGEGRSAVESSIAFAMGSANNHDGSWAGGGFSTPPTDRLST